MLTKTCTLLLASGVLMFAQHGATPTAAEAGEAIFQSTCSKCHGADGEGVSGVKVLSGKFRHDESDADLMNIVRNGIFGTAMPPGNYTAAQLKTIVAYLRFMGDKAVGNAPIPGDPARGKVIVESKGGCLNCHRIRGVGSHLGPDLSDIGFVRSVAQLQESLVDPDAEIRIENRLVRATMKNGTVISGKLLNQDGFSVQILDDKDHLRSLSRSDMRNFAFLEKSPMPSMKGKLSPEEIGDVVNYLNTLKGIENQ